jgi:hypothetical protein
MSCYLWNFSISNLTGPGIYLPYASSSISIQEGLDSNAFHTYWLALVWIRIKKEGNPLMDSSQISISQSAWDLPLCAPLLSHLSLPLLSCLANPPFTASVSHVSRWPSR